jgi:AcrR family transcriptional regulator
MTMEITSKKQKDILIAAKELFWKHGYKRVTIEEICELGKVSKMTFYRNFPNKLELAKAVFEMVVSDSIREFRYLMEENISASEKIKKMLLMKYEGTNEISKEFLQDFYNNPELGVSTYIMQRTSEVWLEVIELYRKGQEDGWLRKDFKPEILLILSQKASELLNDNNVLKLYNNPQELVMEITNLFTYGIVPHD